MTRAQERTPAADRLVATTAALLLPGLLLGWLLQQRPDAPLAATGAALQVRWIEPPPPPIIAPAPPPDTRPPDAPSTPLVAAPLRAAVPPAVPPSVNTPPAPATGMTAAFLEQGRAHARADAGPIEFAAAPLERRGPPPPEDGRFRMRATVSVATVLASIGPMLTPGYEQDPCPRIRGNLANLATGGPGELRDEEVRRHQQLCRP